LRLQGEAGKNQGYAEECFHNWRGKVKILFLLDD
jgi:hypothetical protein